MNRVAVLLLLLLAIPAAADDFALTPVDRVPAEGDQFHLDLASNGSEMLAVWTDERGTATDVFATRLRDDGTAVDPLGIRIAESANFPYVAAAGDGFVVTYARDGEAWLARIEDGRAGAEISLGSGTPVDLATNGRTFCVLVRKETSTTAVFTDAFGNIEAQLSLHNGTQRVAAVNDAYWVTTVHDSGAVWITQLTPAGLRRTRRLGTSSHRSAAIVAAGDRMLAVWFNRYITDVVAEYVVLDAEGNALTPVRRGQASGYWGPNDVIHRPDVAWDGSEFLVIWNDVNPCDYPWFGSLRIMSDGTAVRMDFPNKTRDVATVRHKGAMVVVTTDETPGQYDLFARVAPSFAEVPKAPKTPIAWSPSSQEAPRTAAIGPVAMAVWRQGRVARDVTLALVKPDGRNQLIELSPAVEGTVKLATVTASRDQFLAVWSETRGGYDEVRVLARRIGVDGTVRDPVPIGLRPAAPPISNIVPAAASDGSSFLIVWEEYYGPSFHVAFLRENGKYVPPIAIAGPSTYRAPVRAIWTGSLYAVIWADTKGVRMVRITADGVPLDREPVVLAPEGSSVDAASDGNGHTMVAWNAGDCARAVTLTADGILTSIPSTLMCGPTPQRASVSAAWNGSGFTIYRAHGELGRDTILESLNVSASLVPLGPARVIVGEGAGVFAPSAAALTRGVFLVYERIVDGESAGVRRVFARAAPRRGGR